MESSLVFCFHSLMNKVSGNTKHFLTSSKDVMDLILGTDRECAGI